MGNNAYLPTPTYLYDGFLIERVNFIVVPEKTKVFGLLHKERNEMIGPLAIEFEDLSKLLRK
jgi:hypothetical protein